MEYHVIIEVPERGVVRVTVRSGTDVLAVREGPASGPVDNWLLTTIDSLFKERRLDRFAQMRVSAGSGIDKNSILDKIILTLDAALARAGGGGPS